MSPRKKAASFTIKAYGGADVRDLMRAVSESDETIRLRQALAHLACSNHGYQPDVCFACEQAKALLGGAP